MDAQIDISADDIRNALLDRARRYCVEHETSLSAIGLAAVNDSKFLTRVEKGFGFNVATYQRVMDWLDGRAPTSKQEVA